MKILFEKHEAEEMFHDALCNGLDYIESYGLTLKIKKKDYEQAKLTMENGCYEDYLMQILKDGNKLKLVDDEGEELSLKPGNLQQMVQVCDPKDHFYSFQIYIYFLIG